MCVHVWCDTWFIAYPFSLVQMENEFGTDHVYSVDTFNEMRPKSKWVHSFSCRNIYTATNRLVDQLTALIRSDMTAGKSPITSNAVYILLLMMFMICNGVSVQCDSFILLAPLNIWPCQVAPFTKVWKKQILKLFGMYVYGNWIILVSFWISIKQEMMRLVFTFFHVQVDAGLAIYWWWILETSPDESSLDLSSTGKHIQQVLLPTVSSVLTLLPQTDLILYSIWMDST